MIIYPCGSSFFNSLCLANVRVVDKSEILLVKKMPDPSDNATEKVSLGKQSEQIPQDLGEVEEVSIRMTTIRETSGELVVVPNSFLFKNPVNVLTNRNQRRVTVMTGVAYSENLAKAVEVIEKTVANCETVLKGEPVQVFPQAFGSSSIDTEVTWWTDPRPVDVRRSRGEVVTEVKRALDDAGIEIPFPYRTLTFKEPLMVDNRAMDDTQ